MKKNTRNRTQKKSENVAEGLSKMTKKKKKHLFPLRNGSAIVQTAALFPKEYKVLGRLLFLLRSPYQTAPFRVQVSCVLPAVRPQTVKWGRRGLCWVGGRTSHLDACSCQKKRGSFATFCLHSCCTHLFTMFFFFSLSTEPCCSPTNHPKPLTGKVLFFDNLFGSV